MGGAEHLAHSTLAQRLFQPIAAQRACPPHLLSQAMNDLDRNDHQEGAEIPGQKIPEDVEGSEVDLNSTGVAQAQSQRLRGRR
jgi:hypothetical protein